MIVPFDDQTAVCRTARTVVWEGLALRVSPYPISHIDLGKKLGTTGNKLWPEYSLILCHGAQVSSLY